MGDRCTGHCCRAFYLAQDVSRYAAEGDEQAVFIVGMRRTLLPGSWVPRGEVRSGKLLQEEEVGTYYTCTHVQPNGDCGIYATRPDMCAKYPYGKRCTYPGCTWDEALALPEQEVTL